jgi:hypothetical protein
MSAFGKGTPRRPAIPVTMTSRKESQSTIRSARGSHTEGSRLLERKFRALIDQALILAVAEDDVTEIL